MYSDQPKLEGACTAMVCYCLQEKEQINLAPSTCWVSHCKKLRKCKKKPKMKTTKDQTKQQLLIDHFPFPVMSRKSDKISHYMMRWQRFTDSWTCSSQMEVLTTERLCQNGPVTSVVFKETCQTRALISLDLSSPILSGIYRADNSNQTSTSR